MDKTSQLIAENIIMKNEVQSLKLELQQWKENYNDLSLKYHILEQKKIFAKDLNELENLKHQNQVFLQKDFEQSAIIQEQKQIIEILQNENRQFIDEIDHLQQKARNYDCLKQQHQTLQKASQKFYEELEQLKMAPPQIYVPNPDVTALYTEINRLNKIILERCKISLDYQ